ncbi:MFS transporter [Planotetraspora sp. A-T 1434]|uniref:MFS transporter n=1 Tax=Planotetraspora sp. A-T 1434 TaxID=2979219 RepID=UPI0021BE1E41|nr:MFS transporter [Planotetraspora sp. A-T 1434]MCT9929359.1 MFS transporter [Planotetraspora sp. A-T 1434]
MTSVVTAPPPVFARRYRAMSVGMVALILLLAFEYLAVATAMPVVGRELNGYHLYGLAFSGGLAATVIATVVGGRWSDARGPRAPLWTGIAGFIAGLAVAGAAPTMEVFLAGRFLQGLGGGLFNVALYVLVAQVYPAEMHPRVFSLLAAAWVLPSVVGPGIAGFVAQNLSWRWVFLAVPVLAVPAAFVLWRGLPGGEPQVREAMGRAFLPRLAWGGMAAAGAALLQYGSGTPGTGLPLVIAGLAVLAFALPRLLPPGTLRAVRGLPTVVALRGLAAGAFFAAEVFVPLTLTRVRGLDPAQAGVALTGGALAWSLGSWIQGRGRFGRVPVLRAGTTMIAAGITVTALTVFHQVPVLVAFGGWVLAGLGMGMVYPTLSVLVLELSAPGEEGRNSASLGIGESVFSIVAVAITGALFAGFDGRTPVYLLCFALLVVMAGTGTLIAGRFEHARRAGTMEV